ncbi:MAG: hypothetical protein AB1414_16810, partial [bacterium]
LKGEAIMGNTNGSIEKALAKIKELDAEHFYFVDARLKCPHCRREFGIDREYIGIVTCPYCGKYVEG